MSPDLRIAELELRCYRLELTLRSLLARAANWSVPTVSEYYKNGLKTAYQDVAFTVEAGLKWADGAGEEPP